MELLFKNELVKFDEHDKPTIESIINQINKWIGDEYYFSHLVVNGLEIYDHPELYLEEKLSQVTQIEVFAKTAKEFVNDILLSSEEYLKRAMPELSFLYEEFYQNPSKESWGKFEQMIEGIQWLNDMIRIMDQFESVLQNGNEYVQIKYRMETEIENLEIAVVNDDYVLIADLIQYELIPIFKELEKEILLTIDTEGLRHDVN